MAAWRTKAYALFGFEPGSYSSARGKVDLFADLVGMARRALAGGDEELLGRIAGYVTWAARQPSEGLASAVDLAFFLPVFRDAALCAGLRGRVPEDLFSDKWQALMESPA
jgi:hypothetical protein